MSGTTRSLVPRLDLALLGAEQPVQEWVGPPANRAEPPIHRVWPAHPHVIYAEYKPRLSAQELQARQRGAAAAAPVVALSGSCSALKVHRTGAEAAYRKVRALRSVWWPTLALVTAVLSAGMPGL